MKCKKRVINYWSVVVLVFLVSFASSNIVSAQTCLSASEIAEIRVRFPVLNRDIDLCNEQSVDYMVLSTLLLMKQIQFQDSMAKSSDELFSGRFQNSWYEYFIKRITNIFFEKDCPAGVLAYVSAMHKNDLHVCSGILATNHSNIDRMVAFLHEARHADGFPHTTCTHGVRKGLPQGCDAKILDGGSYAVTVEAYAQIAKYAKNVSLAQKSYARAEALLYADEAFEMPVSIQRSTELLLLDKNKFFYRAILNPTSSSSFNLELKPLGQASSLGHIVMKAQHMIMFPDDKSLTAQYIFAHNEGELGQTPGKIAFDYNQGTSEQRKNFVDYQSSYLWSAFVEKNKLSIACELSGGKVQDLSFPSDVQATGILHLNGYDRSAKFNFVSDQNKTIYQFGCDEGSKAYLQKTNITLDRVYKRIYKIGNFTIGLSLDGSLFQLEGEKSIPLKTILDGTIYEIVPHQFVNFFD